MKQREQLICENPLSLFDERVKIQRIHPCITLSEMIEALNISWCEPAELGWYKSKGIIKKCNCGKVYKLTADSKSSNTDLRESCTCLKEKTIYHYNRNHLNSMQSVCVKAVHVYPESDQVIRFSFQSQIVNLQNAQTLEDYQQIIDQSLKEIGYLRFHLDGTIDQMGVNLLTEEWFIGSAMSEQKAMNQGIRTLCYNTRNPKSCRTMDHYIEADLNQCCYFNYDQHVRGSKLEYVQRTIFYTKIDSKIQSLDHPVAQRHPYFHVMSHEVDQSLGCFTKCFLGCFEMFRRFPQMEQVTKAGYSQISKYWMVEFAKAPMKKYQLHRVFKPGRNLAEITGLQKSLLRLLREENIDYKTYQFVLKIHQTSPLNEESLRILLEVRHKIGFNRLWRNIREKRAESIELLMYLYSCWNRQGITMDEALILWDDYLTMALETNVPFKKFPPMLKMAHDVLARDVKKIRDVREQEMFKERAASLDYLKFEDEETGYGIYIPQTCDDLIIEGRTLHHCVGSYQRRFANGETTILFIRRLEEPNKPLYTLEWDLKKQKIIQLKGNSNSNVTNREALTCLRKWQKRQIIA